MRETKKIEPVQSTKEDNRTGIPEHCPRFEQAAEVLGKRWTGLILRLLQSGPMRFSELESRIPKLSPRMLSQRLRELEEEEIITRDVRSDRSIMVVYTLTDKGKAMMPIIEELKTWAETWC